jgi:hypothetical protein
MSRATCHDVSRVTCHVSHVTCHVSHVIFFPSFFRTKWWSLSVEGLLSTGPTPSSFSYRCLHNCYSFMTGMSSYNSQLTPVFWCILRKEVQQSSPLCLIGLYLNLVITLSSSVESTPLLEPGQAPIQLDVSSVLAPTNLRYPPWKHHIILKSIIITINIIVVIIIFIIVIIIYSYLFNIYLSSSSSWKSQWCGLVQVPSQIRRH